MPGVRGKRVGDEPEVERLRRKSHIQLKLSKTLYVRKNLVVFSLAKTHQHNWSETKTSFVHFLHFSPPSLYQSLSLKILLYQTVIFITKAELEFYFLKNSAAKEDYLLNSNHCSPRSIKTSKILIKFKRLIRKSVKEMIIPVIMGLSSLGE